MLFLLTLTSLALAGNTFSVNPKSPDEYQEMLKNLSSFGRAIQPTDVVTNEARDWREAPVIVTGTCISFSTVDHPAIGVYSIHEFQVHEYHKGSGPSLMKIITPGGLHRADGGWVSEDGGWPAVLPEGRPALIALTAVSSDTSRPSNVPEFSHIPFRTDSGLWWSKYFQDEGSFVMHGDSPVQFSDAGFKPVEWFSKTDPELYGIRKFEGVKVVADKTTRPANVVKWDDFVSSTLTTTRAPIM